ncbi:AT-rich interactive domain-containing protein 2 [Echinococcus granulosus]|uniref:Zinc finger C2H2 and AT rich interactive domain containing protein n=1 Tax=Echinococcus granulosus TaxID=6210 RepID=A0A068WNT8_ECHGR|nr:AT-rich interactive domain-containing protein 2 [Echinococcus granulosus]CDS19331.1 zinc finger C2H2 and AT rich interactive domain containing protein [Echinococcus granulosus]
MLSRHKSRVHVPVGSSSSLVLDISEEQFATELAKLRGVPRYLFNSQPRLNGHPVSLVRLYNEVTLRGGSKKVTSSSLWDEIAGAISLERDCVNIGQAVKNVFQNYLEPFERVHRSLDGQSGAEVSQVLEIDLANDSANLQVVENHLRHRWNLSTDLIESVEYRALLLALESGLPNELDYAINTILLISSQRNGFDLARCPQILPLMLSAVGIYSTGPCSYYLLKDAWRSQCNRDFHTFWRSVVLSKYGCQFLNPDVFYHEHLSKRPDKSFYSCPLTFRDTMTYHDVEGFRVQLVAMVLRNLVVTPSGNSVILSQEPDVLRFVCLCIYSSHTALRQLGLDTLAYLHFPVIGPLSDVLSHLLPDLLSSQDRVDTIRGLMIMRHLCESPVQSHQGNPGSMHNYLIEASTRNIDFLTQSLPRHVIGLILQLACLRDLHMLVLVLDALFALSAQGPALCDALLTERHRFVSTLVGFLTFEAQSLGSDGLIRIRVMQVPGPTSIATAAPTNTATASMSQSSSTRRIMEKPVAPTMAPPEPVKKAPNPTITSCLLLSPAPRPHAGCYAVPVPTTGVATSVAKPLPLPLPPTPATATAQESSVPLPNSVAKTTISVTPLMTAVEAVDSKPQSTTVVLTQVPPQQHATVPQTQVLPVVVTAPKPSVIPSSVTNGKQQLQQQAVERKTSSSPPSQQQQQPRGPLLSSSSTPSLPPSLINTLPKPYPEAPTDKREFAVFWLNKNYEVHPQSSFPRVQIYADYQKAHQAQFGSSSGGALSAGDFHAMIKMVFPPVDQVKVLVPNGNVEIHYNKLKHVDAPEPVEQTLGVQHMLGTCLASQNSEGKGLTHRTTAPASSKSNRKRSAVNLIEGPAAEATAGVKHVRLVEDAVKANGGGGGALTNTTFVNGANAHPIKLLATNTTTFVDSLIPVSSNGPIEFTPNGIHLQQPVIAASAIVLPSMDGKHVLNGFGSTGGGSGGGPAGGSMGMSATGATLIDSSQGVLQFRTLLPTTSNKVSSQCRASLVMQSTAPNATTPGVVTGTGGSGAGAEIAATPTLTCLGTFMTTSTVSGVTGGAQQVFVYSLAPNAQLSIAPTAATILPAVASALTTGPGPGTSPQPHHQPLLTTATAAAVPQQTRLTVPPTVFACRWAECQKSFPSVDRLFSHVYSAHFTPIRGQQEITCKWLGCKESGTRRSSLSLLDHLHEQHCATHPPGAPNKLLSTASTNSVTVESEGSLLTPLTTMKPSLSATRAAVADCEFRQALQADFMPTTSDAMREGPVTKHVRLTAALILHNLATYSSAARRQLRAYETLLCEMALSGTEASSTLIKCLALLSTSPSSEDGEAEKDLSLPPHNLRMVLL